MSQADQPQPDHKPHTLAIDIGGTGIKALVVDARGHAISERTRLKTPRPARPPELIATIMQLLHEQPDFDRISVGFPGVVRGGKIVTADNLHRELVGFDLAEALHKSTGREARLANDAVMQGLGAVSGKGVELMLTLGTGLGSALFVDGKPVPYLEIGHHTGNHEETYAARLCNAERKRIGDKHWRERVARVVEELKEIWDCRAIYLGGGNADLLRLADLPAGVVIVPNTAALLGGVALWPDEAGASDSDHIPGVSRLHWMTVEPTEVAAS